MKKLIFITGLILLTGITFGYVLPRWNSQDQSIKTNLSGTEILDKTIKYHDPNGLWVTYKGKLYEVTMNDKDAKHLWELNNDNIKDI